MRVGDLALGLRGGGTRVEVEGLSGWVDGVGGVEIRVGGRTEGGGGGGGREGIEGG